MERGKRHIPVSTGAGDDESISQWALQWVRGEREGSRWSVSLHGDDRQEPQPAHRGEPSTQANHLQSSPLLGVNVQVHCTAKQGQTP